MCETPSPHSYLMSQLEDCVQDLNYTVSFGGGSQSSEVLSSFPFQFFIFYTYIMYNWIQPRECHTGETATKYEPVSPCVWFFVFWFLEKVNGGCAIQPRGHNENRLSGPPSRMTIWNSTNQFPSSILNMLNILTPLKKAWSSWSSFSHAIQKWL